MSDFTQKNKVAIVIEGGVVASIHSSLSQNVLDVEIFDMDTEVLEEESLRNRLNKMIEDGELPHNLY